MILLTLSGCTNKEFHLGWYDKCLPKTTVDIRKVYPTISNNELNCSEIPKADSNITKQSQVASHLVNLTVVATECKSNLNYVRMLLLNFKQDTK